MVSNSEGAVCSAKREVCAVSLACSLSGSPVFVTSKLSDVKRLQEYQRNLVLFPKKNRRRKPHEKHELRLAG